MTLGWTASPTRTEKARFIFVFCYHIGLLSYMCLLFLARISPVYRAGYARCELQYYSGTLIDVGGRVFR